MQKSKKTKPLPPVRVRQEPPTLEEAVVAAQGLTDDLAQQIEVAAALTGLTEEEMRPHVIDAPPPTWPRIVEPQERAPAPRVVVVQRKSRVGLGGPVAAPMRRPFRNGF